MKYKGWGYLESKFLVIVFLLCFVGSFFIANDKAILSRCSQGLVWFGPTTSVDCKVLWSPLMVDMDAETLIPEVSSYLPPFSSTPEVGLHMLGTDGLGRDVLAGILHGGRKSLVIGLFSAILAVLLGWMVGLSSVFLSRMKLTANVLIAIVGSMLIGLLSLFVSFYPMMVVLAGWAGVLYILFYTRVKQRKVRIGWMLSRGIEWYQALPDLLILLVLASALQVNNEWTLIVIMVLISWPNFALLARREGLEIMDKPYFKQALRNSISYRILFKNYLLKNSLHLFLAVLPISIARFILLETTLSFLGLGLPPDTVTLGSLLNNAKDYLDAWWLFLFSGLFIFLILYAFQRIGHKLLGNNGIRH